MSRSMSNDFSPGVTDQKLAERQDTKLTSGFDSTPKVATPDPAIYREGIKPGMILSMGVETTPAKGEASLENALRNLSAPNTAGQSTGRLVIQNAVPVETSGAFNPGTILVAETTTLPPDLLRKALPPGQAADSLPPFVAFQTTPSVPPITG